MTWRELRAVPPVAVDAGRPVHDRAVAGATPVRGDLLGPLVRRAHRPRPADRVVVVGVDGAELVLHRGHELRRLDGGETVEVGHLVERAVDGALGRGAVVADDVVDERVLQRADRLDGVDQRGRRGNRCARGSRRRPPSAAPAPASARSISSHAGITSGRSVSSASAGTMPVLPAGARTSPALRVPAAGEPAGVPVRPLQRHVVRSVGGAGREVHEERLLGSQRLLGAHPVDRPVRQVLGQVVALLRRSSRLDRRRALVQRRVVLVVLAADEAVEVLEPAAAGGPRVERPDALPVGDRAARRADGVVVIEAPGGAAAR